MVARNWGDGEKRPPVEKKNFANENATKVQNTKRVYPHSSFEITSL
jgi:hypothetical protein